MSDQLPKVICEQCAFKVDELFEFREKVLQTEDMFMEMIKTVIKQDVSSLGRITNYEIQENMDRLTNDIHEMQNSNITRHNVQNDIHTIPTMDSIGLTDREQVITEEELNREETGIEVATFHLDGETVRIVDAQMREVRIFLSSSIQT